MNFKLLLETLDNIDTTDSESVVSESADDFVKIPLSRKMELFKKLDAIGATWNRSVAVTPDGEIAAHEHVIGDDGDRYYFDYYVKKGLLDNVEESEESEQIDEAEMMNIEVGEKVRLTNPKAPARHTVLKIEGQNVHIKKNSGEEIVMPLNRIKKVKYNAMKEESEEVDESEKVDELKGYQGKKGQKLLHKVHSRASERLHKAADKKDIKTTRKNAEIMSNAWDRMNDVHEAKDPSEDIEQIDELSKSALTAVRNRAAGDMMDSDLKDEKATKVEKMASDRLKKIKDAEDEERSQRDYKAWKEDVDMEEVEETEVMDETVSVPVTELADILRLAGFDNVDEKINEYANSPDVHEKDVEEIVSQGDDLNREKSQYPAAEDGDNPMAAFESQLESLIGEMLGEQEETVEETEETVEEDTTEETVESIDDIKRLSGL